MKIAYFINQYPAVSHTFIRREILALERIGVTILRFGLRPSQGDFLHQEDRSELEKTRYVLRAGPVEFIRYLFHWIMRRPFAMMRVSALAAKMGWRSDRGLARHLAYAIEAAVLASWCVRDKVDHIHAHFGTNSAAIAMLASRLSGISYSFTAHGSEEFEKAPLLSLDLKLDHAAFAVCVSAFGRSQLMRWSSPDQWEKIKLVHCGLDRDFLDSSAVAVSSRPRFVCVGRLGEHKAQLILVEAVHRLREKGVQCEVVLAGDGPMRPSVEDAIRRLGLEQQFTITGWVPSERVKEEISAARALILPSFSENMPVAIMEAMALGRPVISTYIAGIPELVRPGKTGWLVPSSDAESLADAMKEAIEAPVDRLMAMGAAGHNYILDQHDAAKEAGKLEQLFRSAARKLC